jgi:signal transduction histidine kinase
LAKLEAVGHLTAGIAHGFNNLLTVIIGNLDLIRDKPKCPNVMQLAASPSVGATRRELVRRMIAFRASRC